MKRPDKTPGKGKRSGRAAHLRGPKRKPLDELAVAKRYLSIPASAVKEIRKASRAYGSPSRSIQAATEILIRLRKRPLLPSEGKCIATIKSYKLISRTIELIDELAGLGF